MCRIFSLSTVILLTTFLTACGVTPKYNYTLQSEYQPTTPIGALVSPEEKSTYVDLIIRFPISIDEDSIDSYKIYRSNNYFKKAFTSTNVKADKEFKWEKDNLNIPLEQSSEKLAVVSVIEKELFANMYFASELYKIFASQYPGLNVVLAPSRLKKTAEGRFVFDNNQTYPKSMYILDVGLLVNESNTMLSLGTFGKYFTPTYSLWCPSLACKSDTPLLQTKFLKIQAQTWPDSGYSGGSWYFTGEESWLSDIALYPHNDIGAVELAELVTLKGDEKTLESYAKISDHRIENSHSAHIFRVISDQVVTKISEEKNTSLSMYLENASIELCDEHLLSKKNEDRLTNKDRKRLAVIDRLTAAETTYWTKTSEDFASSIYNGEFGNNYRSLLVAQNKHEDRRQAIEAIGIGLAIVSMGMSASASAAGTQAGLNSAQAINQTTMLTLMSMSEHTKSSFFVLDDSFANTTNVQRKLTIDIEGTNQNILVDKPEELRSKLRSVYDQYGK